MIRFNTLLKLNIKRAFKALPQLIFGAIALIFLVSAIAFCGNEFLYGTSDTATDSINLSIGVVLKDDSEMATTIADAILNMPQVTDLVDFHFIDEATAMNMLENDELVAAIVIPEDSAHNITHGKNTPITVIFPEDSGLEAVIIKEVADTLSTMLSSAQAGIYSIYDFYDDHGASDYRRDAIQRMNLKYINLVATNQSMFDTTTVTATGSIPLMTYYICGGLVLFSLLFGINCFSFTKNTVANASKRLSLNSVPLIAQGFSLFTAIFTIQIVTMLIIIIPAVWIMGLFDLKLSSTGIAGLLVIIPLFSLISSSFVYIISQITHHGFARIMLTFFVSLALCFISGCFIPSMMLPKLLQDIGYYLPAYHMISFGSKIMSGDFDSLSFFACIGFGLTLFLAGTCFTFLKRRKELC